MENTNQSRKKRSLILIIVLCLVFIALIAGVIWLVSENNKLSQERDSLSAEQENTAAELSALQADQAETAGALEDANQTVDDLQTQLLTLQSENEAVQQVGDAAVADLQTEFDSYKTNSETKLAAAVAAGEADVQAAKEEGAQKLNDLQTEFDTYKADAQAALDALQAAFDAYKADAEARLAAVGEADQQVGQEETAQKLIDLQAEFDTYKADALAALAALQSEFDAYKADAENRLTAAGVADLQAGKDEAAQKLSDLQAEFDTYKTGAQAALDALQTEFDAYKADAEARLAMVGEAGTPAETPADAQSLADLQAAFDAYKADAQAALVALQSEYDTYKADAQTNLEAAVEAGEADLQAAKDDATEALAALQADFDTYKASAEDALATAIETGQADVKSAKDDAAEALAALQTDFDTYKAGAEDTLTALQADFDAYQTASQATVSEAEQAAESAQQTAARLSVPSDTNGAGNRENGNLAVYYEGNVYYQNNYHDGNIYMENAAGYEDLFLRKTNSTGVSFVRNIAAVADGSLYYINANRLYRFDLQSEKAEYMKNNMNLYSQNGMYIYGEKIYFLKSPVDIDGNPVDNLYDIKFSCNNLEEVPGVRASGFTGDGQYLYYTEVDTNNFVRFDIEAGENVVLLEGGNVHSLNVAGDMLYFSDGGQIMKMKTDGTELESIGDVRGSSLNVVGDWVYYSNLDDHEKIYRMTTSGQYNEKVFDVENTCCINIAGGWIYFIQYTGSGDQWTVIDTYKARLDGSGLTLAMP